MPDSHMPFPDYNRRLSHFLVQPGGSEGETDPTALIAWGYYDDGEPGAILFGTGDEEDDREINLQQAAALAGVMMWFGRRLLDRDDANDLTGR